MAMIAAARIPQLHWTMRVQTVWWGPQAIHRPCDVVKPWRTMEKACTEPPHSPPPPGTTPLRLWTGVGGLSLERGATTLPTTTLYNTTLPADRSGRGPLDRRASTFPSASQHTISATPGRAGSAVERAAGSQHTGDYVLVSAEQTRERASPPRPQFLNGHRFQRPATASSPSMWRPVELPMSARSQRARSGRGGLHIPHIPSQSGPRPEDGGFEGNHQHLQARSLIDADMGPPGQPAAGGRLTSSWEDPRDRPLIDFYGQEEDWPMHEAQGRHYRVVPSTMEYGTGLPEGIPIQGGAMQRLYATVPQDPTAYVLPLARIQEVADYFTPDCFHLDVKGRLLFERAWRRMELKFRVHLGTQFLYLQGLMATVLEPPDWTVVRQKSPTWLQQWYHSPPQDPLRYTVGDLLQSHQAGASGVSGTWRYLEEHIMGAFGLQPEDAGSLPYHRGVDTPNTLLAEVSRVTRGDDRTSVRAFVQLLCKHPGLLDLAIHALPAAHTIITRPEGVSMRQVRSLADAMTNLEGLRNRRGEPVLPVMTAQQVPMQHGPAQMMPTAPAACPICIQDDHTADRCPVTVPSARAAPWTTADVRKVNLRRTRQGLPPIKAWLPFEKGGALRLAVGASNPTPNARREGANGAGGSQQAGNQRQAEAGATPRAVTFAPSAGDAASNSLDTYFRRGEQDNMSTVLSAGSIAQGGDTPVFAAYGAPLADHPRLFELDQQSGHVQGQQEVHPRVFGVNAVCVLDTPQAVKPVQMDRVRADGGSMLSQVYWLILRKWRMEGGAGNPQAVVGGRLWVLCCCDEVDAAAQPLDFVGGDDDTLPAIFKAPLPTLLKFAQHICKTRGVDSVARVGAHLYTVCSSPVPTNEGVLAEEQNSVKQAMPGLLDGSPPHLSSLANGPLPTSSPQPPSDPHPSLALTSGLAVDMPTTVPVLPAVAVHVVQVEGDQVAVANVVDVTTRMGQGMPTSYDPMDPKQAAEQATLQQHQVDTVFSSAKPRDPVAAATGDAHLCELYRKILWHSAGIQGKPIRIEHKGRLWTLQYCGGQDPKSVTVQPPPAEQASFPTGLRSFETYLRHAKAVEDNVREAVQYIAAAGIAPHAELDGHLFSLVSSPAPRAGLLSGDMLSPVSRSNSGSYTQASSAQSLPRGTEAVGGTRREYRTAAEVAPGLVHVDADLVQRVAQLSKEEMAALLQYVSQGQEHAVLAAQVASSDDRQVWKTSFHSKDRSLKPIEVPADHPIFSLWRRLVATPARLLSLSGMPGAALCFNLDGRWWYVSADKIYVDTGAGAPVIRKEFAVRLGLTWQRAPATVVGVNGPSKIEGIVPAHLWQVVLGMGTAAHVGVTGDLYVVDTPSTPGVETWMVLISSAQFRLIGGRYDAVRSEISWLPFLEKHGDPWTRVTARVTNDDRTADLHRELRDVLDSRAERVVSMETLLDRAQAKQVPDPQPVVEVPVNTVHVSNASEDPDEMVRLVLNQMQEVNSVCDAKALADCRMFLEMGDEHNAMQALATTRAGVAEGRSDSALQPVGRLLHEVNVGGDEVTVAQCQPVRARAQGKDRGLTVTPEMMVPPNASCSPRWPGLHPGGSPGMG